MADGEIVAAEIFHPDAFPFQYRQSQRRAWRYQSRAQRHRRHRWARCGQRIRRGPVGQHRRHPAGSRRYGPFTGVCQSHRASESKPDRERPSSTWTWS